jgi:hypothetical protein
MLFDLSGKRRSVIKVIYATLALLMGGSLVLFGIGSDAPGGILDAVGLGSGSSGSSTPQYDEQIDNAEERLQTDPQNENALIDLVHYHYLSATTGGGIETDPATLATTVDSDAQEEFAAALDAWDNYLETNPKPVDPETAGEVAQVNNTLYLAALTSGDASEALSAAEAATEAQREAIGPDATAADYGALARYAWIAGETEVADRAAREAIALTDKSQRAQIEQTLEQTETQLTKFHDRLDKLAKQAGAEGEGGAIEDPFGGLGGAPGATAP